MKKNRVLTCVALLSLLYACNKKEETVAPTISNEALTTVLVIVVNTQSPMDTDTATWEQLLDNNGNPLPADVSKANLNLKANATYNAQIRILDKSQNPYQDVTQEIKDRANYHLFFYQPLPSTQPFVIPTATSDTLPLPIPSQASTLAPVASNPLNLTATITDHDTNPQQYPVGLQATFATGAASTGWLRIVLRHQPNVKNGMFAPGSTDLDVGYNVKIQ
jgi:hypothetical protein